MTKSTEEAKRNPISLRYDLLDFEFLEAMAKIADYGAKTYGEGNWKLSRLKGDKSPINHIMKHIKQYQEKQEYDHKEIGSEYTLQLAAIAFNAMMEFYHAKKELKIHEDDL